MDAISLMYTLLIILFTIFAYIYQKLRENYRYWEKRKVPYLKPSSYIFGVEKPIIAGELAIVEHHHKIYNQLAPHKFGGVFSFQHPILVVRDPELVKHVLTKDFDHFYDRSCYFVNKKEPLTFHLFNLCGDEWKILRAKLTPTFTSGKLKLMFPYIKECADELVKTIGQSEQKDSLEMKDLLARYSTDVISSCAFGLQANSLQDPNSEFRRMGRQALSPSMMTRIRDLVFAAAPSLIQRLGIRSFDDEVTEFFFKLVRDMVKYRDENNITRNDFLNLVMQLRNEDLAKNKDKAKPLRKNGILNEDNMLEFTLDLLTAQCFVMFLAGFETSSSALSFGLFELARHTDVQKKVQDEIDRVLQSYNGQVTYEALQKMTYIDQVIAEITRKYPALAFLTRTCMKDYKLPDTDVIIERDTVVFIPVYGIHHDPEYYSDPNGFNPEHFSEEAKASRPNYTHLAFGDGPRVCIGMRFGLMQVKLGLVMLLKNYNFKVSPKMQLPFKFIKHSILTNIEGGILLKCEQRKKTSL